MLRLVLGFKTFDNTEEPQILYCGSEGSLLQLAVDTAPEDVVRIVGADIPTTYPIRRSGTGAKARRVMPKRKKQSG